MVSISQVVLAAALGVFVAATPTHAQGTVTPALMTGDFYKPTGSEVSGVVGATTQYRRSPCPAINALANHGYLPRNGQNITRAILKKGIMSVYNMGEGISSLLVSQVPEEFSLDFLSTHNNIEHDASLVHSDTYVGKDPAAVNPDLLADLLGRANAQGRLGVKELAAARKQRIQTCRKENPKCDFGIKQETLAFGEAALLLLALGGDQGESISKAHAESFLLEEKIPADYKRPATDVSALELTATAAKVKTLSIF